MRSAGLGRWLAGTCAAAGLFLAAGVSDSAQGQTATAPAQNASRTAINLIVNSGFEQEGGHRPLPAGWNGDAGIYARDETIARTGHASLGFANPDPDTYRLCSRRLPVAPGCKYRFSAYVKTEGIIGRGSGATVCLEWQDEAGQYLGGSYPPGVKGTADWTLVEDITRIPREAASVSLICYVRKGMTGRAWFDDVEVMELRDPPMQTILMSPVYRGWITRDGPDWIRVRARLDPAREEAPGASARIGGRLQTTDGTRLYSYSTEERPAAQPFDLEFPTALLETGEYVVVVELVDAQGNPLQTDRHSVLRLDDDFEAGVAVDEYRRLIVDGNPFFPIGMYWSAIDEHDLRIYADSRFNCLMPYASPDREEMDLILEHGLRVIYSMKDFYAGSRWSPAFIKTEADEEPNVRAQIRRFRDHPALLGWYLNDELPEPYMPRLEMHYRWVKEEDPGHPAWAVLCEAPEVGRYLNTFDVVGTDPYPIAREPASMAAEWTVETLRRVEGARPLWQVVQAFNRGNYRNVDYEDATTRTPTYEEMRSMAWQCICEGATGIFFYSFQDIKRNPDIPFKTQWDNLKRIAAEIDALTPMLLSVEPVVDVETAFAPEEPDWLHWTARSWGGALYLFAVNDGDGGGRVMFTLGKDIRHVRALGDNRVIEHQRRGFEDRLGPLDVRIYKVDAEE
ncbi:MAG: hypothetical protein KAW17_04425 [Candidatus Eisenbacteria sp.]|nr:hypothetical protein [Candidatus Eisenbacteria bacterium]